MTEKLAYLNPELSYEDRAKDLVSRMTVKEKVSQMIHKSCAIPRLNIPTYNWWNEALHGVARAGVATMFPQVIGMAATFDKKMIYEVADVTSTEGRAKFHESQRKNDRGIYKGLTFWAPNVNIFRDPRWGRGHETFGEDPYLTGQLGVAFIKGIQGDDPVYLKAAACAKHFAVHSGPEDERHEFNAEVTQKDLYETYLPAFRDCVIDGKVEAVMGAYNRVNGEPACGSKTLLEDILRRDWGFQGHVVSDCWAIKDFHEKHGVTSTEVESAAYALNNGCDLNCGNLYKRLLEAYDEGKIEEKTLDKALARLMVTRIKLGLFDDEGNVPYASIPYDMNDHPEHRRLALETAKKTLVLLKNKQQTLPLSRETLKSVAVIGPNADSRAALTGNYEGTASEYVTVLEGIREAIGDETRLYYAEGCDLYEKKRATLAGPENRLAEALSVAEQAEAVVIVTGLDATIEGEEMHESNEFGSGDKYDLKLPGLQQTLLEQVTAAGKQVIVVNLSGSAMDLSWAEENTDAIIQGWYPGGQGGRAIASLLFGDYSPSAKLPVTFYYDNDKLPDFRDYNMADRTYRFMTYEALYPFGYGLSYTSFTFEKAGHTASQVKAGEAFRISYTVTNTGDMASHEVVQLYISVKTEEHRKTNWELKGFEKIHLQPGQSVNLSFNIEPKQYSVINEAGERVIKPAEIKLFIGNRQPDERSSTLTGTEVLTYHITLTGAEQKIDY